MEPGPTGTGLLRPPARFGRSAAAGQLWHQRAPWLLLGGSFTEAHIPAITQAICEFRAMQGHGRPALYGEGYPRAFEAGATAWHWKCWPPMALTRSMQRDDGVTPDPRSFHERFSSITAAASNDWLMESLSPPPIIHRRTEVSNTIPRMAGRPTLTSHVGLRTAPTNS